MTQEELQEKQLKLQTWGMYISIASVIIMGLSLWYQSSQNSKN